MQAAWTQCCRASAAQRTSFNLWTRSDAGGEPVLDAFLRAAGAFDFG
jgi:hypothetical protein